MVDVNSSELREILEILDGMNALIAERNHVRDERDRLQAQVDELQAKMSEMVNHSLKRQVRAFHFKFGHPVAWEPTIPSEEQIRFRLQLITEEFGELLAACGIDTYGAPRSVEIIREAISRATLEVDLPELVDAMADLDYVVEGTRAVFGINGDPIAREVQRANMDKDAIHVAETDSAKRGERIKPKKPEGWRPPDIASCLREQGWKP